jgi:hypothetical protein
MISKIICIDMVLLIENIRPPVGSESAFKAEQPEVYRIISLAWIFLYRSVAESSPPSLQMLYTTTSIVCAEPTALSNVAELAVSSPSDINTMILVPV